MDPEHVAIVFSIISVVLALCIIFLSRLNTKLALRVIELNRENQDLFEENQKLRKEQ